MQGQQEPQVLVAQALKLLLANTEGGGGAEVVVEALAEVGDLGEEMVVGIDPLKLHPTHLPQSLQGTGAQGDPKTAADDQVGAATLDEAAPIRELLVGHPQMTPLHQHTSSHS